MSHGATTKTTNNVQVHYPHPPLLATLMARKRHVTPQMGNKHELVQHLTAPWRPMFHATRAPRLWSTWKPPRHLHQCSPQKHLANVCHEASSYPGPSFVARWHFAKLTRVAHMTLGDGQPHQGGQVTMAGKMAVHFDHQLQLTGSSNSHTQKKNH